MLRLVFASLLMKSFPPSLPSMHLQFVFCISFIDSVAQFSFHFTLYHHFRSNQNCRLPHCPHRGCSDTKPLILHLKICIAGPNFPCPTNYRGCNEARKLLAHYRKCKDVRTRQHQAFSSTGGGGLVGRQLLRPTDQGSCLVCSLMARYAKNMMERTAAAIHSNNNNSPQPKNDNSMITSSSHGQVNNTDENGLANFATHPQHPKRTPSMTLMPPPPPRRLSQLLLSNGGSRANNDCHNNMGMTIPMLWTSVSTSSSSTSSLSSTSSPGGGKILGSTVLEGDGSLVVPCATTTNNSFNTLRQRAVSYDERQSVELFDDGELQPPANTSSRRSRRGYYSGVNGSEELQQYDATSRPSSSSVLSTTRGYDYNFVNGSRPRSASCSNLTMGCNNSTVMLRSLPSHHECGTIAED